MCQSRLAEVHVVVNHSGDKKQSRGLDYLIALCARQLVVAEYLYNLAVVHYYRALELLAVVHDCGVAYKCAHGHLSVLLER